MYRNAKGSARNTCRTPRRPWSAAKRSASRCFSHCSLFSAHNEMTEQATVKTHAGKTDSYGPVCVCVCVCVFVCVCVYIHISCVCVCVYRFSPTGAGGQWERKISSDHTRTAPAIHDAMRVRALDGARAGPSAGPSRRQRVRPRSKKTSSVR